MSSALPAAACARRSASPCANITALLLAADAGVASFRPCDAIAADSPLEYALLPAQADTLFSQRTGVSPHSASVPTTPLFHFEAVLGQFASSCDEAIPERIDPSDYAGELFVAPLQQPVFLAYEVSALAVVSFGGNLRSPIAGEAPWTLEACLGCQDGQLLSCSAAAVPVEVTDSVWLRIAWEANPV